MHSIILDEIIKRTAERNILASRLSEVRKAVVSYLEKLPDERALLLEIIDGRSTAQKVKP